MPWEDYLSTELGVETRLPPSFKTFDYFNPETGLATSAKTVNTLTKSKLTDPRQIARTLKGNVDETLAFTEYETQGMRLESEAIAARQLRVAVPSGTTPAQWEQIGLAVEYGKNQGVDVIVTAVR